MVSEGFRKAGKIRKKYWLRNALIRFPLLVLKRKRNKKIWIFGCWAGNRYDDSCKYLYEFVLKNNKEITPFWITKNINVYEMLLSEGKPVLYDDSKSAKRILRKAGAVFYSNGLDDISDLFLMSGALIFDLNHAPIAFKTLRYFNFYHKSKIINCLKRVKKSIFNWFYFDYTIATSDISKKMWMTAFEEFDQKKYVLCGLPRYDVMFDKKKLFTAKLSFYDKNQKYILYLPTYRKYKNNVINEMIESLINNSEMIDMLKRYNYKVVIKPHFAEDIDVSILNNDDTIVLIGQNDLVSTQELLAISDILITDYSSCMVDFAITNKPIYIYAPDLEVYKEKNGIDSMFSEMYSSKLIIKSIEDLLCNLRKSVRGDVETTNSATSILSVYNKNETNVPYSNYIMEFVMRKLGI